MDIGNIELDTRIRFSDMVADRYYNVDCMIKALSQKVTANGKDFIDVTLCDGETDIVAKLWDSKVENLEYKVSDIAAFNLRSKIYNGSLSFDIKGINKQLDPSLTPMDFVISAPYKSDDMFDELIKIVESLSPNDNSISSLAAELLYENEQQFKSWAAAQKIHHAIYGGLLFHSLRMAQSAMKLCDVYRVLDRELLVCGAVLHDIGKLYELKSLNGQAEYTPQGLMFGHAYLGMKMIEKKLSTGKYPSEKGVSLLHMIASHHEQLEFGAIATPMTAEACALHMIDDLDAKIYQYEDQYKKIKPGELSSDKLFGLNGSKVYRPAHLTEEKLGKIYNK